MKRTVNEREHDLIETEHLYIRNVPMAEIARRISEGKTYAIGPGQIRYDVADIRKRWQERYLEDMTEQLYLEPRKVDAVEFEAWEAWQKSKAKAQRTIQQSTSLGQGDPGRQLARIETEESVGDARFLELVLQCVKDRCVLLGIIRYKMELEIKERVTGMTNEELEAESKKLQGHIDAEVAKKVQRVLTGGGGTDPGN